jgi:hypothetical protein
MKVDAKKKFRLKIVEKDKPQNPKALQQAQLSSTNKANQTSNKITNEN